jgi:nitroreductase
MRLVRSFSSVRSGGLPLADAFETISRLSFAQKTFSTVPLPESVLRKVIELTQLAPSSFNLQPYKLIVIRSEVQKLTLSDAMLGNNRGKVKMAPVTVVFASEKGRNSCTV